MTIEKTNPPQQLLSAKYFTQPAEMTIPIKKKLYHRMNEVFAQASCTDWNDISDMLVRLKDSVPLPSPSTRKDFLDRVGKGIAFITFEYGIDGVSIEISKYGKALESYLEGPEDVAIHLIGGDFSPQANSVIMDHWQKLRIEGINGWSKWDDGRWFSGLYYEDMQEGSRKSNALAKEIFAQAASIAERMGRYLLEKEVSLLIPVNIGCNPGNFALTLALALMSEAMGIYVINSNHDFYWEGGKAGTDRRTRKPVGLRDHFFRNVENRPFFTLFESLYPWNGQRWLQVNINSRQSRRLIREFALSKSKVFELSTSLSDRFFEDYSQDDVKLARLRMAHILSDGKPIIGPMSVNAHCRGLTDWMDDQTPRVLGARSELNLDLTSDDLIYLLQPTRVIARKQVERNLILIKELLAREKFRKAFAKNNNLQIVLHITGPTPIEHQEDHEKIIDGYKNVIDSVPSGIADRVFVAFSGGQETHHSFPGNNFRRLHIEDIYRMANVVVFPSEREGRGLPIIEASASGIPIICSRYSPDEVFAEVVGEDLSEENQIDYLLFPQGTFPESFLQKVTKLLLHPELNENRIQHNKNAVRARFSAAKLEKSFGNLLEKLRILS